LEKVIGIASENDEDIEVFMPQKKGSLGVELFLKDGEECEPWRFEYVKSECAASRPIWVNAWDSDADKMQTLAFHVLGNGVLELCVKGRILSGNLGLIDDVVFVGLQKRKHKSTRGCVNSHTKKNAGTNIGKRASH
jgi:hypothetical protein